VDPLLQPLTVNGLQLRNRVYSPAHAPTGYLEDGGPGERTVAYHEAKARGGAALTIVGGSSSVSVDSADVFSNFYCGGREILPFYRSLSERIHAHEAAVMVQITHLGRRSKSDVVHWLPTVAPSAVREHAHRSYPKEMEDFDFRRIVADYGTAAALAQEGGLDGIEVAALAGHLIDQFWSPRTNHRTDEYGGSLDNRMRFGFEVLQEVRNQVGRDFVVGMRLPGNEWTAGGLDSDDGIAIASALADSGLIDYMSIVVGGGETSRELADLIPGFGRPLGGGLDVAKGIKGRVSLPIFHAGRIADVSTARHAIDSGAVDMVGMVRAHIADPDIMVKVQRGEEDRVRPCVGASFCLGAAGTYCIHNPSTGREQVLPHSISKAQSRRKVVVVGGGVAGLEAARVCAERGHEVVLLEASDRYGGQLAVLSRTTRQSEKLSIVDWLVAELRHLGVQCKLNSFAEAQDVLALEPDVVITATGGVPNLNLPGGGEEHVVSAADALGRRLPENTRVVVFDDDGGEVALTVAESLAERGATVELLTPDPNVGVDVSPILMPDYLTALYRLGVVVRPDSTVNGVSREGAGVVVTTQNVYTDTVGETRADMVVVDRGTLPYDDLYHELRAESTNRGQLDLAAFADGREMDVDTNPTGKYQLYRIGDAVSHRGIHGAVLDARRLCQHL
jgi:N-methyl-L-proline demethylase